MSVCGKCGVIGKWTTPTITYKPSQAEVADIEEIFAVISQGGEDILTLSIESAAITEDGFEWYLTQEQTSHLTTSKMAAIQIDYKTKEGRRYTTNPKQFSVVESAVPEVI